METLKIRKYPSAYRLIEVTPILEVLLQHFDGFRPWVRRATFVDGKSRPKNQGRRFSTLGPPRDLCQRKIPTKRQPGRRLSTLDQIRYLFNGKSRQKRYNGRRVLVSDAGATKCFSHGQAIGKISETSFGTIYVHASVPEHRGQQNIPVRFHFVFLSVCQILMLLKETLSHVHCICAVLQS